MVWDEDAATRRLVIAFKPGAWTPEELREFDELTADLVEYQKSEEAAEVSLSEQLTPKEGE